MSEIRASKADMDFRRVVILSPELEEAELVIEIDLLGFPGIEVTILDCRERQELESGSIFVFYGN